MACSTPRQSAVADSNVSHRRSRKRTAEVGAENVTDAGGGLECRPSIQERRLLLAAALVVSPVS